MKISELLNIDLIKLDLTGDNKEDVLEEMVDLLAQENKIDSKQDFYETILDREKEGTTGLGRGIAIPHGKSDVVNELALVFGRSRTGIDFDSLDGKEVNLFFMISDYKGHSPQYLEILSNLMAKLRKKEYRDALLNASSPQEVIKVTKEYE